MIFQDCGGTLNPIRKIGSQYVEYICTHEPMAKKEAWQKAVSMLSKMRLPGCGEYHEQLSLSAVRRYAVSVSALPWR